MNNKGKIIKTFAQDLLQLDSTNGIREEMEIGEDKDRMFIDMIEELFNEVSRADQRTVAYVTTAMPISDGIARKLSETLSRLTGRETELSVSVDESILGGVIVRIGSKVIDGSLRGRLEKIRDELLIGSR